MLQIFIFKYSQSKRNRYFKNNVNYLFNATINIEKVTIHFLGCE